MVADYLLSYNFVWIVNSSDYTAYLYVFKSKNYLPFQMWSISLFDVLFTKKLEQDRRTHVKVIKTSPLHQTLSNIFSFVIISWWHWAHLSQKKKQSSHFARHSKGNFCLIFSQQMTIIPYSPVPQDYALFPRTIMTPFHSFWPSEHLWPLCLLSYYTVLWYICGISLVLFVLFIWEHYPDKKGQINI